MEYLNPELGMFYFSYYAHNVVRTRRGRHGMGVRGVGVHCVGIHSVSFHGVGVH
jgi:hypothetical protein